MILSEYRTSTTYNSQKQKKVLLSHSKKRVDDSTQPQLQLLPWHIPVLISVNGSIAASALTTERPTFRASPFVHIKQWIFQITRGSLEESFLFPTFSEEQGKIMMTDQIFF
jgi:hypothetical protein